MQTFKKIFFIIIIGGLWRSAQVIFSVAFNPLNSHHAGLSSGKRTHIITNIGYSQIKQERVKSGQPSPIEDTALTRYNAQCIYGQGKCQSFLMQGFIAGIQRISTIQYIGKYITLSDINDTANQLNIVTDLNPLWPYPYVFAQALGPTTKKDHTDITGSLMTWDNSILIGEKGISYQCDDKKLKKIKNLTYKEFLLAVEEKNPNVRAPCSDYRIAHNLAFNYFQYKNNSESAAYYYMVSALHDDVPGITLVMPAIVRGRAGDNLISAYIRYDRFQNAVNQYNKIKDKKSDEAKEGEKTIQTTIKKAVSEISLYLLSQTYPGGLQTGQTISPEQIAITIKKIRSDCKKNQTACELISYGIDQGRIKNNGILIYPIDDTMTYGRRSDRNIWRLVKKKQ